MLSHEEMNDLSTDRTPTKIFNAQYLILFFSNMIVSIGYPMVSSTMALYLTDIGYTKAIAGVVIGIMSIASLCIRPFTGLLSDSVSRKKLMILSNIGITIAMVGYSITSSIPALSVFRVIHGVSFSISTTTSMALIASTLPKDKMGQGLGYFAASQFVGGAFAPSLGIWMGQAIGYKLTFVISGVIVGLSALLMMMLHTEEELNGSIAEKWNEIRKTPLRKLPSFFFAKEVIMYAVIAGSLSATKGIEHNFIPLDGKSLGIENIGWYFTIGSFATLAARLFFGKLGDKYGFIKVLCGCTAMIVCAYLLLIFAGTGPTVVFLACAAAFKALGNGIVQPAVQATSLRSVSVERRGKASSTYYLGCDIGQSLAPILGGVAIDLVGYRSMFAFAIIPLVTCTVLYVLFSSSFSNNKAE